MILYLVYDKKNHTSTAPAIAPSFEDAQQALLSINPENLDDLVIHELTHLNSILDIFLLTIDTNKSLPDFLISRSDDVTPSSTQPAAGELPHD